MLSMALAAGTLCACGKEEDKSGSGAAKRVSGAPEAEGGTPLQPAGRYVEKEEELPEELADWQIAQMFPAQGQLHFLTMKQQDGKTILREWEKQGDTLADVTQGWLSSLAFDCGGWLEVQLMQDGEGRQYLYAGYVEEEAYKGHLWKGAGDTAEEITPEKWKVPNEEWGGYEMIQGMAALDNGTLASVSYSSSDLLSGEDGSVLESGSSDGFYEGSVVSDGENVYLCSQDGSSGWIEKRKEGKSGDAVMIPYPGSGSSGGADMVMSFGGSGSLVLDALKDGTLIAAGEKGIFRMPGQTDAEKEWEKLVDGIETDFAVTDYWCMDLAALEDGSIYALFQADGEMKLNRYEYDPDAVSQVTQELKLYTVYESSLLKQAATLYHKAHPEVLITIQNEYPMYLDEKPDYNGVYQKLNTMLLGDEAPDILVMDHLDIDSYASKGLLVDLEDVVRPLEESGALLENITGAYVREDGKRYVVPLQFGFNMVLGRDIKTEEMASMEALADFLSKSDYSCLGPQTVAELVDKFYPYFCEEIVREKQLDKEVLGRYLEYLKAIGDNSGMITSRPENELCYSMWDLGAKAKLAFRQTGGFLDCMFPMSMVKYIKGDFTAFENRFIPSMQMGICAKTQYQDTALDFLQFALSGQVQDSEYNNGFPVNRDSMKKQAAKDRSDVSAAIMIETDDGGYMEFDSEAYPQETADRLAALCGTLDRPVGEDEKIRQVLIECLGGYLDGTQAKEEVIQKIEDGLKMYLAE